MSYNTPIFKKPDSIGYMRVWCQKVLPSVYDDSLSYYELLCKVVAYLNDVVSNLTTSNDNVEKLFDAFTTLTNYVNNYFDTLDIQNEINNAFMKFVEDGNFNALLEEDVNNSVANAIKKNIVLIGDSYGTGTGGGENISNPFPIRTKNLLSMGSENFAFKFRNGAGFCNGLFLDNLNNVDVAEPSGVTDVYVLGGWNDENGRSGVSEDAFFTALATFKSRAKELFPNAKLHLCFISWGYSTGNNAALRTTWQWYRTSSAYGWIYHENMSWCMHNATLMADDKYHPNEQGMAILARNLASVIETGDCHVYYNFDNNMVASDSVVVVEGSSTAIIQETLVDGVTSLRFYVGTKPFCFVPSSGNLIANGDIIELGTYPMRVLKGSSNNVFIPVGVTVYTNEGETINCNGKLAFLNGSVNFMRPFIGTPDSPLTAKQFTNVRAICISAGCGAYPTIF